MPACLPYEAANGMSLLLATSATCAILCLLGGVYGLLNWRAINKASRWLSGFVLASGLAEASGLALSMLGRRNWAPGNLWELAIPTLLFPAILNASSIKTHEVISWLMKLLVVAWCSWFIGYVGIDGPFRVFHLVMCVISISLLPTIDARHWPMTLGALFGFCLDLPVYLAWDKWLEKIAKEGDFFVWQLKAFGWLAGYLLMTYHILNEVKRGHNRKIQPIRRHFSPNL